MNNRTKWHIGSDIIAMFGEFRHYRGECIPSLVPNCSLRRVWASNSFILSMCLSISAISSTRNGQMNPMHHTETGMDPSPDMTVRFL